MLNGNYILSLFYLNLSWIPTIKLYVCCLFLHVYRLSYNPCPIICYSSYIYGIYEPICHSGGSLYLNRNKIWLFPIFDASKLKLSPGNQAFNLRHFEVNCYSLLTNSHCYLGKWWEYSWDSRQLWWSGLSCRTYTALETSSFEAGPCCTRDASIVTDGNLLR